MLRKFVRFIIFLCLLCDFLHSALGLFLKIPFLRRLNDPAFLVALIVCLIFVIIGTCGGFGIIKWAFETDD